LTNLVCKSTSQQFALQTHSEASCSDSPSSRRRPEPAEGTGSRGDTYERHLDGIGELSRFVGGAEKKKDSIWLAVVVGSLNPKLKILAFTTIFENGGRLGKMIFN
jgi:hypothetical protein